MKWKEVLVCILLGLAIVVSSCCPLVGLTYRSIQFKSKAIVVNTPTGIYYCDSYSIDNGFVGTGCISSDFLYPKTIYLENLTGVTIEEGD